MGIYHNTENRGVSTTRPTHVAERPRIWVGVLLLVTAAVALSIAVTDPRLETLVYAPLVGAAVTLFGLLAAKANQVFFGDRTDHVATHQRLWAGVLLGITTVIAAVEVAGGESVLYGAFLGLFVALPITTACLLAAKLNQWLVQGRRNV